MRPEQLSDLYPELYHIAWGGSWESIKANGLLSTKALLRLYGKSEEEFIALTQKHRPNCVKINSNNLPQAVIRDQKPMDDGGLIKALPENFKPWQWYDLLNSMVFFWPTKQRLKTMISAQAYRQIKHDVLIIDTQKLVELEEPSIRLSRMNSGCTKPYPHQRDMSLFKTFEDYPFNSRLKQSGWEKAIAEVCVLDKVDRIEEAVIDTKHGFAKDILDDLGICTEPKPKRKNPKPSQNFRKLF